MAESNEALEQARELREKVDKVTVEFIEAYERYTGNWRAQKWEEDVREWQGVEQKRQAMNDAWREYGDFLEQHRSFLKSVQAL